LPTETTVKISVAGNFMHLKNLVTGETIAGQAPPPEQGWQRQDETDDSRISFTVTLPPHSYAVFAEEN
jgi:hypothetical protein